MRHLVYATMGENNITIQTDFSAQYPHKAAWTNTCEHPPTSNMDVFVVTRVSIGVDDRRTYITDVWRIFSAAKGSAAFHNKCLDQIVQYYRAVITLEEVYVCTDGCRGQYKGRRNFRNLGVFAHTHSAANYEAGDAPSPTNTFESLSTPSCADLHSIVRSVLAGAEAAASATVTNSTLSRQPTTTLSSIPRRLTQPHPTPPPIRNVIVRHLFACGHHFKGPHDGYGKDAKFMPKTAERHHKARIATTHDLYYFNATNLPCPRYTMLCHILSHHAMPHSTPHLTPHLVSSNSTYNPTPFRTGQTSLPPKSSPLCRRCDQMNLRHWRRTNFLRTGKVFFTMPTHRVESDAFHVTRSLHPHPLSTSLLPPTSPTLSMTLSTRG